MANLLSLPLYVYIDHPKEASLDYPKEALNHPKEASLAARRNGTPKEDPDVQQLASLKDLHHKLVA